VITFRRILYPVDFSERCAAVAPVVKAMAGRFGSQLLVLHVVDLLPTLAGPPEAAVWATLVDADRLREDGKVALERFIAREFPGIPVTAEVDEGDPARQIVQYAAEDHADLIMMPTSGRGLFRTLLLGSVTAKVLHDAHCPVWTGVHAEELLAHSPDRWKRMLCAVDTGAGDVNVLRWAAEFAAGQGLEVRLVHAVRGADATLTPDSDPSMYEFLFNVARERLATMQAEAGTNFEVSLRAGNPGLAVHERAAADAADVVVIGRGVMQETLGRLRSSAYSIIREAPCPVISI
jgi:nucleotide-binding universal stress UspA family protein